MATTLVTILVQVAISAALSYLAYALTPKAKQKVVDSKPSYASRGSPIPRVIGRRRIGCVVGWVGRRIVSKKDSGNKYYEAAWHQLCVGPADALYAIYENGKKIWDTPLRRSEVASGSVFDCEDDRGCFSIFWGECDQPVDVGGGVGTCSNGSNVWLGLANETGVKSRWPNLCYIVWHWKKLDTSPMWPTMEYDVEVGINDVVLANSGPDVSGQGLNVGHVFWELATASFPYGSAVPAEYFDEDSVEYLGQYSEAERFGVSLYIQDNSETDEVVSSMMDEFDFFLVQRGSKLYPYLVRDVGEAELPALNSDIIETTSIEQEKEHGERYADRLMVSFADLNRKFTANDVGMDDDATSYGRKRPNAKTVALKTVIVRESAVQVLKRKMLKEMGEATAYTIIGSRDCRKLVPGTPITVQGFNEQLRVASVKPEFNSSRVEVSVLVDIYSFPRLEWTPNDPDDLDGGGSGDPSSGGSGGVDTANPEPDLAFAAMPVPSEFASLQALWILRVRKHAGIVTAQVWYSRDDSTHSFHQLKRNQDAWCVGGKLNAPITTATTTTIAVGPTITPLGPDIGQVLDLSADDNSWNDGVQCALIDNEIFFLKKVTKVSGGYQLEGLQRAQFSTTAATHAANSVVYIFRPSELEIIPAWPLLNPGTTIWIKTLPGTSKKSLTLSDVTAIERTF